MQSIDNYHKNSKKWIRQIWALANSTDPDQTAPEGAVWSGPILFPIPSTSFEHITALFNQSTPSLGPFQQ